MRYSAQKEEYISCDCAAFHPCGQSYDFIEPRFHGYLFFIIICEIHLKIRAKRNLLISPTKPA